MDLYGDDLAVTLARGYCHKLQHFFNLELTSSRGFAFVITPAVFDAYEEPTDFARVAIEFTTFREAVARIQKIRGLLSP